ncbi:MAG TPA: ATP-binding protein [Verrucomicrobiae bacterium]|nr:ATP-binding protein [Verrucomicrobiae bacterium]
MQPETLDRNGTIFGREAELTRLRTALAARRSFLFHGPRGAGKTLLMTSLVREDSKLLYCSGARSLEACMRTIGRLLANNGNRMAAGKLDTRKAISAVSLNGILRAALAVSAYTIVLDHCGFTSQSFVSGLSEIVVPSATPIVAIARSPHMEELGYIRKLFPFRSDNVELTNFAPATANNFVACAIATAQLHATNLPDFRERLLNASAGNPGAILTMIQMARQPKYRSGEQILFSPLYVDFRLRSEMLA